MKTLLDVAKEQQQKNEEKLCVAPAIYKLLFKTIPDFESLFKTVTVNSKNNNDVEDESDDLDEGIQENNFATVDETDSISSLEKIFFVKIVTQWR